MLKRHKFKIRNTLHSNVSGNIIKVYTIKCNTGKEYTM